MIDQSITLLYIASIYSQSNDRHLHARPLLVGTGV